MCRETPEEGKVKNFGRSTLKIVNGDSRGVATELGSAIVNKRHLAIALFESDFVLIRQPLETLGINLQQVADHLRNAERPPGKIFGLIPVMADISYDNEVRNIIENAHLESTGSYITPQHLLLSLLWRERENPDLGLERFGIEYQSFKEAVLRIVPNTGSSLDLRGI